MTANVLCRVTVAGIVLLTSASVAHASPILTLFNTGVFANGTVVPNGTIGDLHYTLATVPGGTTVLQARTSAGSFPIPPWLGDDTLSTWIGPNNDSSVDGPPGNYDYRTTFSLAGFNPSTASVTVKWTVDNSGVDVLLNGISTGHTVSAAVGFTAFTTFTLTSGFSSGLNTLDFIVNNAPGSPPSDNPTGLRVELAGTANTPEPASFLLFGAGLVGVSLIRRRRAQGSKG